MSMSKQNFITLADVIRVASGCKLQFSKEQIELLADFCQAQNPNFKRERWLSYIAGTCGQNGGAVKKAGRQ